MQEKQALADAPQWGCTKLIAGCYSLVDAIRQIFPM